MGPVAVSDFFRDSCAPPLYGTQLPSSFSHHLSRARLDGTRTCSREWGKGVPTPWPADGTRKRMVGCAGARGAAQAGMARRAARHDGRRGLATGAKASMDARQAGSERMPPVLALLAVHPVPHQALTVKRGGFNIMMIGGIRDQHAMKSGTCACFLILLGVWSGNAALLSLDHAPTIARLPLPPARPDVDVERGARPGRLRNALHPRFVAP